MTTESLSRNPTQGKYPGTDAIGRACRLFWRILANDASGAHIARDALKVEFLRLASEVGEGFGEQVAERLALWFREQAVPNASQAEAVAAFEHGIKQLISPAEYYLAINKPRGRA
jgi:hypothetical protein